MGLVRRHIHAVILYLMKSDSNESQYLKLFRQALHDTAPSNATVYSIFQNSRSEHFSR